MIQELREAIEHIDTVLARVKIALLLEVTEAMLVLQADLLAEKAALEQTIENYMLAWKEGKA